MRIQGPFRELKREKVPGPGEYDFERADSLTKSRSVAVIFKPIINQLIA